MVLNYEYHIRRLACNLAMDKGMTIAAAAARAAADAELRQQHFRDLLAITEAGGQATSNTNPSELSATLPKWERAATTQAQAATQSEAEAPQATTPSALQDRGFMNYLVEFKKYFDWCEDYENFYDYTLLSEFLLAQPVQLTHLTLQRSGHREVSQWARTRHRTSMHS